PTCSPTSSVTCWRTRWRTRSRPSWCWSRPAAWNAGSASGSRTASDAGGAAGWRVDGVCAGVDFRSPRSLVAELTGTVQEDPWAPDALAWPLLEVIDERLDAPWNDRSEAHP